VLGVNAALLGKLYSDMHRGLGTEGREGNYPPFALMTGLRPGLTCFRRHTFLCRGVPALPGGGERRLGERGLPFAPAMTCFIRQHPAAR
jgi:hypothetical protein